MRHEGCHVFRLGALGDVLVSECTGDDRFYRHRMASRWVDVGRGRRMMRGLRDAI